MGIKLSKIAASTKGDWQTSYLTVMKAHIKTDLARAEPKSTQAKALYCHGEAFTSNAERCHNAHRNVQIEIETWIPCVPQTAITQLQNTILAVATIVLKQLMNFE